MEDSTAEHQKRKKGSSRMELFDWVSCIVTALIFGVLIFVFLGRTIGVDGRSMLQTLYHNDRVIMSNLMYTPGNGDIVVFQSASEMFHGTPLVKRVIAIEGQTIDICDDTGGVYIDGRALSEPYIQSATTGRLDFDGPVTIPTGYVFVMGDNRLSSTDSREDVVGLVDTRQILGRVSFVLVPGADHAGNRDWSRFGFVS